MNETGCESLAADAASQKDGELTVVDPSWAPFAWGFLAYGVLVSFMAMLSFFLTGDRVPAYWAMGSGALFVACILPVGWAVDRFSEVVRKSARNTNGDRQHEARQGEPDRERNEPMSWLHDNLIELAAVLDMPEGEVEDSEPVARAAVAFYLRWLVGVRPEHSVETGLSLTSAGNLRMQWRRGRVDFTADIGPQALWLQRASNAETESVYAALRVDLLLGFFALGALPALRYPDPESAAAEPEANPTPDMIEAAIELLTGRRVGGF